VHAVRRHAMCRVTSGALTSSIAGILGTELLFDRTKEALGFAPNTCP
jgi:hypothetical protein